MDLSFNSFLLFAFQEAFQLPLLKKAKLLPDKFNSKTVQNKGYDIKTSKQNQNHYRKQSWWQIHTTSCSSLSPVSLIIISISWFSPSTLFRNRDPVDLVIGITGTRAVFGMGA